MTETRFHIICQNSIWYNDSKHRDGFTTLSEAQEAFHEVREYIQRTHSNTHGPDAKWFIVQTVMAIPMTAPPQYSFEPLQLAPPIIEPAPIDQWPNEPDDEIPF